METKIAKIETITQCNRLFSEKTLHPLISLVTLSDTQCHNLLQMGFYSVLLKEHAMQCRCLCGWRECDFSNGTLMFLPPLQTLNCTSAEKKVKGSLLCFHPDLIRGTSLEDHMDDYTFFHYRKNEALHLSDDEKMIFTDCLDKISLELSHPIDKHSKLLISKNIELLLDYCMRFYERQFITRSVVNKSVVVRFDELLDDYFHSGKTQSEGLPTVKYFADKICLSPNYFGDLIKKATGRTAQEYIQGKIMDVAKDMIIGTDKSVGEIAYSLGFQYPQHFSRVFKKCTGNTPNEYRYSRHKDSTSM